jgi:Holliday junction resolvase RusA-like endonuclease
MRYPLAPHSKPRMTQSDTWKRRPCVLAYRAFKDLIAAYAVAIPQPCSIVFHIGMPSSWSEKKKAAHDGQPHLTRPDLDNLLKGLLDAALTEDCVIWNVHCEKRWGRMPGIEITKV